MAIVSAPFTGDRTKVKQVDTDKYEYEGNYYTGTFDNATNWGSNYADIGKSQPTTTTAPAPAANSYGNDGFGYPTGTQTNPYANLPTYPTGTPQAIDWTKFFPQQPAPGTNTGTPVARTTDTGSGSGGAITGSDTRPAPPAGYTVDPTTGAWVWDGHSEMLQGPWAGLPTNPANMAAPGGTTTNTAATGDWIDQALQQAQSTDDPAYWRRVIAADPKVAAGDQSAIAYWKNRIAIGDGALAVRNGTQQRFQDNGPTVTGAQGPRTVPGYTPLAATQSGSAQDAVGYLNQLSHSMGGGDLTQDELAKYAAMVGYKEGQPVSGAMLNSIAQAMMQARGYAAPGTGPTTPPPGGNYDPTNPFDDPATKNYIDLLNTRIQELLKPRQDPSLDAFMKMISERVNSLNTPYTNPDAAPLQEWMRKYMTQLESPTYTDAQRDTINTQTLDPMERQRQNELRNVATTMANRGIDPKSGPYLQAERDINNKYDQIRAQTQAGLSVNEINQVRNDQGQAATVGGQLANFTQGQFANNENRANQATSLFGTIPQLNLAEFQNQDQRANSAVTLARQIPDLAQSRITSATQLLNGSNINPASLLQTLQGFQQQGIGQSGQDSQFWQSLIANFAKIYGLG